MLWLVFIAIGVIMLAFLIPYWFIGIPSRIVTNRILRKWQTESDERERKSLLEDTDYKLLIIAQNRGFLPRTQEIVREILWQRGVNPNRPIDETVNGYPKDSLLPRVHVRSHFRKKSFRRR
jgi:hypothetical protein